MSRTLRNSAVGLIGAAALCFGQWDVNQLWANTVKQGTAWGQVHLALDTLDLEVTVSGGLIRTKATMSWTPGLLSTVTSRWVSDCSVQLKMADTVTVCAGNSVQDTIRNEVADSLEMRSYLQLPFDAAATGLWLWVGDQKQTAYVMDRWKAREQYNQIVGARRDPVLLETWGNGSYNINLFPMKSGETRKMQIEIVQAMKEGLALPVVARKYQSYDYVKRAYVDDAARAGFVRLAVRSDVNTNTTLDLGALGRIPVVAGTSLHSWNSPDSVVMTVSGKQPEVWTAVRDGKGAFGGNPTFKGADLRFESEPMDRLIVLDATDSLERVRKLALLSLLKYGKAPYKANLAWFDGKNIQKLWSESKSIDSESNALEALAFLKDWKPYVKADAKQVLGEVVKSDTGAVVVLISTSLSPVRDWDCFYPGGAQDVALLAAYYACSDAYSKRWSDYNQIWLDLGKAMSGAGQTLFGWWNDYYVSNAASSTGGFTFGSVFYPWSYWRWTGDSISAPAMYGPNRHGYREAPENLKLEIDGIKIDSLAYLFQQTNSYWYWGWARPMFRGGGTMDMIAIRKASVAARSAASVEYVNSYDDSLPLVFAARYAKGGAAQLKVSGTWGGLRFQGTRSVVVPDPSGTEWGTRVWAGEYANMLQPNIWSDTSVQGSVRAIGKGYGIVTPATSFLALEPGMKPLDSLAGTANGTSDAKVGSASYSSVRGVSSNSEVVVVSPEESALDATSLEDLIAGRISSVKKSAGLPEVGLKIRTGAMVDLEVLGHEEGLAKVRILDLKGREVASVPMTRSGDRWVASWKPTGRGVFFAVAEGARWKHSSTFTVGR